MRQIVWLILFFETASGFFFPCVAGSHVDMLEGLWEISTRVQIDGGSAPVQAITTRQCITPENILPEINRFNASDPNCRISNLVIGRNFAAYDFSCVLENGEMRGQGSVTYRGERLKGSLTTFSMPENEEMSYEYSGWYIGPCR